MLIGTGRYLAGGAAPPLYSQALAISPELRMGRTIRNEDDILLQFGLETDFDPERSRIAEVAAAILSLPYYVARPAQRRIARLIYGLEIHGFDDNYLLDQNVSPVFRNLLTQVHAACNH